ncbi:MAG: SH3 domain-containing protein [Reichenbachiella sp.]
MNKKQSLLFNLFSVFLILSLIPFSEAFSQEKSLELIEADSLFKEKKYTESYTIYEKIMRSEEKATPQMLMRMAFIKEGLGDHSLALFYLNQYYLKTSDRNAQQKMENLASEHELRGYDGSDTVFFIWLVNKYYFEFIGLILFISTLMLTVIVFRKIKKKGTTTPYAISLIILLVLFYFVINYQLSQEQVIIIENHAYLMSGPSSGSDLVDVVQKGHRVQFLDDDGIWVKVEWNGQEVYIRKSKIKPIS